MFYSPPSSLTPSPEWTKVFGSAQRVPINRLQAIRSQHPLTDIVYGEEPLGVLVEASRQVYVLHQQLLAQAKELDIISQSAVHQLIDELVPLVMPIHEDTTGYVRGLLEKRGIRSSTYDQVYTDLIIEKLLERIATDDDDTAP